MVKFKMYIYWKVNGNFGARRRYDTDVLRRFSWVESHPVGKPNFFFATIVGDYKKLIDSLWDMVEKAPAVSLTNKYFFCFVSSAKPNCNTFIHFADQNTFLVQKFENLIKYFFLHELDHTWKSTHMSLSNFVNGTSFLWLLLISVTLTSQYFVG